MLCLAGCLLCLTIGLASCSGGKQQPAEEPEEGTHEVVCTPTEVPGGFGYVILVDNDTLIFQPFIPAIGGHQPFADEESAMRVAQLVVEKMLRGEPFSLTREEVEAALVD